jgi:hypothetical protein
VSGDTRVSGASIWLAEGASQRPPCGSGIRTRGSQRPDDSQGRTRHMEQEGGSFKMNRDDGNQNHNTATEYRCTKFRQKFNAVALLPKYSADWRACVQILSPFISQPQRA